MVSRDACMTALDPLEGNRHFVRKFGMELSLEQTDAAALAQRQAS